MELTGMLLATSKQLFSLIAGLAGIGFLIGLHELGHFIFCKIFGVNTPSFSIGFGPMLFKKKIGNTLFSLSLIPIGGYVEIAGSEEVGQGEQKEAKRDDQHSFKAKNYFQKILIMSGGILFNLAFAYTIIIMLYTAGMPKTALLYPENATTVIASVRTDSPAQKAGLQPQDSIVAINNVTVKNNHQKLLAAIKALGDQEATITVERNGHQEKKTITLASTEENGQKIGILGVVFDTSAAPARPLGQAIKDGFATTNNLMKQVFFAIKGLFVKRNVNSVGGPLMIISATVQSAHKGLKLFLLLLAFISANLAVLNLLPLPILDGGQILVVTIETIAGRDLPEKIKLLIHYACWYGFLALLLYLTYKDIGRIISSLFAS